MKKEDFPFEKFSSETQSLIKRYIEMKEHGGNCFFDKDEFEILIDCFLEACPTTYEAREVLQSAYMTYPDEIEIKAKAAKILIFEEHYKKALDILEKLPINEIDADYIGMKGECYVHLNYIKKAVETFDYYLQVCNFSEIHHAFLDITSIFNEKNKYQSALDYAEQGLALFPDSPRLLYEKAYDLAKLNRYEEAVAAFNTLLDITPYDLEAWRSLCITYWELHNYDEAYKCCDYILAIDPNNKEAIEIKANCLFYKDEYEKALAIYENIDDNEVTPQTILQKAQCYEYTEQWDKAKSTYQKIIKKATSLDIEWLEVSKMAWVGLTNYHVYAENDYPKALSSIKKALKKFPDDIFLLFRAGQLEAEYGGISGDDKYLHSAIQKLEQCVYVYPEHPMFNFELGTTYLQLSMYGKAVVHLLRAEEHSDTDLPNIYMFITICFYALNEHNKAKIYFTKAKALYANAEKMFLQIFPYAKSFIEKLK